MPWLGPKVPLLLGRPAALGWFDPILRKDGRVTAEIVNLDGSSDRTLPIPDPTLALPGG
jgi:hypothetical protein